MDSLRLCRASLPRYRYGEGGLVEARGERRVYLHTDWGYGAMVLEACGVLDGLGCVCFVEREQRD